MMQNIIQYDIIHIINSNVAIYLYRKQQDN